MADAPKSPYMGLDKALLRSTRRDAPSADQQASIPENQETGKPVSQKTRKPVDEAPREKMTYMLRIDALDGVEEIKRFLKRSHNIKATNQRVVEEAILLLYEDFQKNKDTSLLVSRFTSNPGRK